MKSNQTEKAERLFTALGDLDPKTVASATAYIPKTAEATRKSWSAPSPAGKARALCFSLSENFYISARLGLSNNEKHTRLPAFPLGEGGAPKGRDG